MVKENKESKFTKFKNEVVASVVGVTKLAFITSTGVAAYVLAYSTDSLTLHAVSVVLCVRVALDALALSRTK